MLQKRLSSNPHIVPGLSDVRKALLISSVRGGEDQVMTPLFENMGGEEMEEIYGDAGERSERKLEMCRQAMAVSRQSHFGKPALDKQA